MLLMLAASLVQTIVPTVQIPPKSADSCAAFEDPVGSGGKSRDRIEVGDLATITNIGRASPGPAPSSFGISPDGKWIAIVVNRANPDTNAYCFKLLVLPLREAGEPTEADRGGDFIQDDFSLRNFTAILAGWPKPNTPRWSPDGSKIAYLKRLAGNTEVWVADPTGKEPARPVSHLADEPDNFMWLPDGNALVVVTRPGIRIAAENIAQEAKEGFLFDERFAPQFADRPIPTGKFENSYFRVSLADGKAQPATGPEAALLAPDRPVSISPIARNYRPGGDGYSAWLEPKFPDRILSPTRLVIAGPDGRKVICESKACEGIRGLWWSPQERALYFQQVTGWGRSQMALQRWDIGNPAPERILVSDDVFIGCSVAAKELVCEREGSTSPRRIVAVNMRSGAQRMIFDPNPVFRQFNLGSVQRLRFRNSYGNESFADLVLPPDHKPGERHPLVVVQYRSTGFLRGGTGDEVPIFPLAGRGFAVLSFERPYFLPEALKATKEVELRNSDSDPWADRRQVQSSLEVALELALKTGTIDPGLMGISGLSDGSSTAQFALVNSDLFKSATLGSCCEDKSSFALAAGPYFTDYLRGMGYRYFDSDPEEFWAPMSLIQNADTVNTPILIQASDSEYEGSLDVIEAYSHLGKPIELHVFPNEPHLKWQPAHRLAMYERNVDWFEFWLMKRIDCDPSKEKQYLRWKSMVGAPAPEELRCRAPASGRP